MKRKMIALLAGTMIMSVLTVTGCGNANSETKQETEAGETKAGETKAEETKSDETNVEMTGMANPWVTSDKEGVAEATGISIDTPEGAKDVQYSYMNTDKLAQTVYTIDGTEFTYRVVPSNEYQDISGCYYNWTSKEDGKVSYCDAEYFSYVGENEEPDVQVVNWYDAVPGLMYSLSATGDDLNGMDIQAYAEQIFVPAQGDTDGDDVTVTDEGNVEITDYSSYIGTYKTENEDTFTINEDKTIEISIVRLASMDGVITGSSKGIIAITAIDPNEGDMGLEYNTETGELIVTDSNWDLLENGAIFVFKE